MKLAGTLGSSYVDANPNQQEEDPTTHEERGHQGDEELFADVPSVLVLGGGDLITEEPRSDGGSQVGSLGCCICGWPRAPFCQARGNLLLCPRLLFFSF